MVTVKIKAPPVVYNTLYNIYYNAKDYNYSIREV